MRRAGHHSRLPRIPRRILHHRATAANTLGRRQSLSRTGTATSRSKSMNIASMIFNPKSNSIDSDLGSDRPRQTGRKNKLLAAARATLVLAFGLLSYRFAAAQNLPTLCEPKSTKQFQNGREHLPDPRYRSPMGIWEIEHVASMVAKATGRQAAGRIAVADGVSVARISGTLEAGKIQINPVAARMIPPNSWAFIIGHELAHCTHGIGHQGRTSPEDEFRADVIGAQYASKAGFDLAAHVAWVLARQSDEWSESHGSLHDRASRLGARLGAPIESVRMHIQRYGLR